MKSVTCETASLADAVNRAARVAPTKGAAFDKAQGIQLEIRPSSEHPLRVRATDLESTFFTRVPVVETGDEDADWRLPTALISGFVSGLPMTAGKTVTLTDDNGVITIKSGRSRAKIRSIVDRIPDFKLFDPTGMVEVGSFPRRVNQVAWAVAREIPPLTGVHISGEHLIACDRTRVVFLPCKVPVDKPVTAPMGKLSALLRNLDSVKLRATADRLEMMPDADTQLTCALYAEPYPDMRTLLSFETPIVLTIKRAELLDAINRMLVLVKTERFPKMRATFENDTLTMEMVLDEVGEVHEVVGLGSSIEKPFGLWLTPENLRDAASNSTRDTFKLHTTGDGLKPLRFTDDGDYEAWIMPLHVPEAEA